jgi:hypothetical protein
MLPEVLPFSVRGATVSHLSSELLTLSILQSYKRPGCKHSAFSYRRIGLAAQACEERVVSAQYLSKSLLGHICACGRVACSRCLPWARCCASSTVQQPDLRLLFHLSSELPKSSRNRCACVALLRGGCNLAVLPSHCSTASQSLPVRAQLGYF